MSAHLWTFAMKSFIRIIFLSIMNMSQSLSTQTFIFFSCLLKTQLMLRKCQILKNISSFFDDAIDDSITRNEKKIEKWNDHFIDEIYCIHCLNFWRDDNTFFWLHLWRHAFSSCISSNEHEMYCWMKIRFCIFDKLFSFAKYLCRRDILWQNLLSIFIYFSYF